MITDGCNPNCSAVEPPLRKAAGTVCFVLLMAVEGQMTKTVCLIVFSIEPVITTFWVLRQKELYHSDPAEKPDDSAEIFQDGKKAAFELSSEKRKNLQQALLSLLEKDTIFKDPELNIENVCEMLCTNRTYLSRIINRDMNTSFYQLINTCRLNKAVEMMNNPRHRHTSLTTIAEICGFKSLSAFSQFFKQTYGKTPTEWREKEEYG